MILLQISTGIEKTFLNEWGAVGGFLILALVGIAFLVKYAKKLNEEEKARIIKDKDESQQKMEIVYAEMKTMQEAHNDKNMQMMTSILETNNKNVETLQENTKALNNFSAVLGKIIDKL